MKTNANLDVTQWVEPLKELQSLLSRSPVVAGFDGFVDEIISVVEERTSLNEWKPVPSISKFGDLIKAAAGRSSLREIIVHRADPGGCAVNLGDGLIALGFPLHCFATLGRPIHSAFEAFVSKCASCHSWGREPGRTLAFEFSDGKLMFSAVSQLAEFDCQMLDQALQDGVYLQACQQAKLIALTDWTLYPHMTSCWAKLQRDVYGQLKHRPYFFIDLVDPSGRTDKDIEAMLQTIPHLEKSGPVILGLNGTEANVLGRILGIPPAVEELKAVKSLAESLRAKLGISQVVIHCIRLAAVSDANSSFALPGPYCAKPKKSTGAGDRFNAGYCCGQILGLPSKASLATGCAASGYFVRHAQSPDLSQLAQFMEDWGNQRLE